MLLRKDGTVATRLQMLVDIASVDVDEHEEGVVWTPRPDAVPETP